MTDIVWTTIFFASSFLLNFLSITCDSKSISAFDKELECFSQSKVYHRQTDKCFKLLTRGPCEPGFWYVLEKPKNKSGDENRITAICKEEKCPEGGYYWVKTKSCVLPKDKIRLCGNTSDEELLNNVFGEAECACARDPPRARFNGDENGHCYQLYTQGPCQQGEVLAFPSDELDRAICLKDECYAETLRRRAQGKLSKYGVLAPWVNGSCYELGTQGPCSETLQFKVHKTSLQPHCVTLTNAIFDLEKPQNCYQDENGDCQKRINKFQSADKYKEELLAALTSAKKKRSIK
ncbi:hypothetical protein RUM44_004324 [Polyplax serrata]|uniref:DUF4789 domain-containing protein n=1 Tax=Polyplax serrata TaxID=468196 RepID=A0ABR1B4B9_POLSC